MGKRQPSSVLALALGLALAGTLAVGIARSAKQTAQQLCFSNLARLARATLMYVADHDGKFPPHQAPMEPYTCQWGADNSNPWLRWPVVLEPYLPDRSTYLCQGVKALPLGHSVATRPAWITSQCITTKGWPNGPCGSVWPPGWGGAVTDSATQGLCLDPKRFRSTVGSASMVLGGLKLSSIKEPRRSLMWADSSRMCLNLGSVLYANACRVDCATLKDRADWDNCRWSRECGAGGNFTKSKTVRRKFTRHNGGSNLAFVDGHVEWLTVDQIIRRYRGGKLAGVAPASATKGKPWYFK